MRILFICLVCLHGVRGQSDELGQGFQTTHTHFTQMGTITGLIDHVEPFLTQQAGTNPQEFFMFRGIPYGRPPVGERRWKDAEPVLNWNRELDATRVRPPCPRTQSTPGTGVTEDCLYLNVFTKNIIKARSAFDQAGGNPSSSSSRAQSVSLPLRPVIVFLPGFESEGAGAFGAHKLMREDLVVVTVEYRSGALGFLSDGYSSLPGNYGMTDVLLALRWVQAAIAGFGGNPRQVTLSGHGQGATIAHLLALQSSASGLFHQVILQSGSSLCPGAISRYGEKKKTAPHLLNNLEDKRNEETSRGLDPYRIYKKILSNTGCYTLTCLRSKSVQEILSAQKLIEKDMLSTTTAFVPIIDETLRSTPIVSSPSQGALSLSSMMIGSTLDEGYSIVKSFAEQRQGDLTSQKSIRNKVLPELMKQLLGSTRGQQLEIVEAVYRQYFSEIPEGNTNMVVDSLGELVGDFLVNSCLRDTVNFHRSRGTTSVYSYVFSHYSPQLSNQYDHRAGYQANGYSGYPSVAEEPVARGSELSYLWTMDQGRSHIPVQPGNQEVRFDEKLLSKNMTNIWVEFAKSGIPYPFFGQGLPVVSPTGEQTQVWRRVDESGPVGYYNISLEKAGMFYDYKRWESTFWSVQLKYIEVLSTRINTYKGYIVSTFIFVVLLVGALSVLIFFIWQLRKTTKQRTDSGRGGYSGWLANMNSQNAPQSNMNQCS